MRGINTRGIVLSRIDYAEADRIITFLTPDQGKVTVIAKGVRKQKSKLAGGIELFSVSEISYIPGRREIGTLISSRLVKHYGNIVKDLDRTSLAFQLIITTNKATEDSPEQAYFNLLTQLFEALDDSAINIQLVQTWFSAQLLRLGGHTPNLRTEQSGVKLQASKKYDFNFETMSFQPGKTYNADQIKFLRLLFSNNSPDVLQKIDGLPKLISQSRALVERQLSLHLG